MRLLHRRALFFVVLFWVAMGRSVIAQEMRRVTVHLHIDVPTGLALPENYRPELTHSPSRKVYCATKAGGDGDFLLTGEVPNDATVLHVELRELFSADREFATPPEIAEKPRIDAFWKFTKRMWTPERLRVQLEPGIHEYTLAVNAERAVTIRGVFKDSAGKGIAPSLMRSNHSNRMLTTRATARGFAAFGVRADHESWLAYSQECPSGEFSVRYFAASELASDINLGTIVVASKASPVFADISVSNVHEIPDVAGTAGVEGAQSKLRTITAIAENGNEFSVMFLASGRTSAAPEEDEGAGPARLEARTYFLVPGRPDLSPYAEKVLRLLRAGRAGDLAAAGVPRISPVAGETVTMTVDAADVVKRIEGIRE